MDLMPGLLIPSDNAKDILMLTVALLAICLPCPSLFKPVVIALFPQLMLSADTSCQPDFSCFGLALPDMS